MLPFSANCNEEIENIQLKAKLKRVNCDSNWLKHNENCIDSDSKIALDWSFTPSYKNSYPLHIIPEYLDCEILAGVEEPSSMVPITKESSSSEKKSIKILPKDSKFRQTLDESSQTEKAIVINIYEIPSINVEHDKATITQKFFDQPYKLCKEHVSSSRYKRIGGLNTGVLFVPFKLRSGDIYSDTTVGPYLSYKFERLEFIGLLGLTQVSVSEVGTKEVSSENGITYALGVSLEVTKDWDIAFLAGIDHLSGSVGDEWRYQDEPWFSFAIGFNFTR